MKFQPAAIDGVVLVEPNVWRDFRGYFFESFNQKLFQDNGLTLSFVQTNQSHSAKGVLRGLHTQLKQPQGKLVRVLKGEIYDVVVDVRAGSPTFKKWEAFRLSDSNFQSVFVPPGCLHGFLTLSDMADVEYHVTDFFNKEDDTGVVWNDSDIGVTWPLKDPILSDKDKMLPSFAQLIGRLSELKK